MLHRVHFQTDHSLSTAHDNYVASIGHDQYKHARRRHPFIVQFPAGCGITCHEAVKARVGSGHHSVLSASYAQVMVRPEEMGALQAHLGEAVVLDYAAMLPSLKVERKTHAVSQMDTTCGSSDAGGSVFQAVLAPQEDAGLASVLSLLRGVVADFSSSSSVAAGGSAVVVSLRVDPGGLQAGAENTVVFEVRCAAGSEASAPVTAAALSQLVSSISALPVVLWVEHREPVKTHNRWASGLCQSGVAENHPMFDSGLTGMFFCFGWLKLVLCCVMWSC
jgi:hypothetical protein